MTTLIEPVELVIANSIQKRLTRLFRVQCVTAVSNDRTKLTQTVKEGNAIEYPQLYLIPKGYSENTESYNKFYLTRFGLDCFFDDSGNRHRVHLKPVLQRFDVEYVTNDSSFLGKNSTQQFIKRWLFAKDLGQLKSTIKYGSLPIDVHVDMAGDADVEESTSIDNGPKEYVVKLNLIVHGYLSLLGTSQVGTITAVEQTNQVTAQRDKPNQTSYTWSFPNDFKDS